jgi:hypothetical protein
LSLSGGHLRHPSYASTPQARVLVAVSPAVDRSLDEAALSAQARVQLCQRPANGVALGFVVQTIPLVLVFGAACAWVHAILGLEVLWQFVDIDRLYVAANCVLHLDAITGVLKSDPLDSVLVLPNDQRSGSRDWAWGSVRVDIGTARGASVHVRRANWRTLGRCLWWAKS